MQAPLRKPDQHQRSGDGGGAHPVERMKRLDVRLPSEYEHYRAEGSLNIPAQSLRLKMKGLDRNVHYVVCCDTGRRSSACGYLLSERGFQASVLKNGLPAAELSK